MRTDMKDDEPVEVAMAPLIDCVFLLLIFFLVATTLKKIDEELPLTLPDAENVLEVQQPEDWLVVSVDESGDFYLDGNPVNVTMLQNELRARYRSNPDVKVRVDADRGVEFVKVMEILDMLRFENIANIGINTRQD